MGVVVFSALWRVGSEPKSSSRFGEIIGKRKYSVFLNESSVFFFTFLIIYQTQERQNKSIVEIINW